MRITRQPDGVRFDLNTSVVDWLETLPIQAATAIATYVNELGSDALSADALWVPADILSGWSRVVMEHLSLPGNCPLSLDLKLTGAMGQSDARIMLRWLQPGKSLPSRDARLDGVWLHDRGTTYRLQAPLYEVTQHVARFNALTQTGLGEHFRLWGAIRELLGADQTERLSDTYLRSLRIITASAMTFSITSDAVGDVQIAPVLMHETAGPDGGSERSRSRALTERDEQLFVERMDVLDANVAAFPLTSGTYVVADELLQKTLGIVRAIRKAPPEARKRAAMQPEAVIREALGQDDDATTAFVETEKYAERVREIGAWSEPVLPWIKLDSQDWSGPRNGGVVLDGIELPLSQEAVTTALHAMEEALASGSPAITIDGQPVPATSANRDALVKLQKALQQREPPEEGQLEGVEVKKNILIIENNFNDTAFEQIAQPRRPGVAGLPSGLKTLPKKHQETGIGWLQTHWLSGSRGALLCDDMGLGKTFQALAFCVWLREAMQEGLLPQKPLLVVAPVGLLMNWEQEIEEHLYAPGLGMVLRAYGPHLKLLRRGRHLDGSATLDTTRLASADVILANYEAVSDYQLSFGAVPFAAVILDEAQKIKSPKTRVTHAIKALNTEFMVAMTGTPVENRFSDLWCIADAVQPGALKDLKSFSERYETSNDHVSALREAIWQEEARLDESPRLLLRRLKRDKLEGLPEQHVHVLENDMPPTQLATYQRALALQEVSGPDGVLGMIHALRRASLHPLLVEGGVKGNELRIEDSARFIGLFQALDEIARKGEKALIFVESLDLQDVDQLPLLIQRRYQLPKPPMVINGTVDTKARQERVDAFQRDPRFDVMLLSPKAGGVGLTLTAANHVIHLSRWWNPAVEDQCSDRVYRIGQQKPVHVYYPLALIPDAHEHSFDLKLQALMDRKRRLAQDLLVAPVFTSADYAELI